MNNNDNISGIFLAIIYEMNRAAGDKNFGRAIHNKRILDNVADTEKQIQNTDKQIDKTAKFARIPGMRAAGVLIFLYAATNMLRMAQIQKLQSQIVR